MSPLTHEKALNVAMRLSLGLAFTGCAATSAPLSNEGDLATAPDAITTANTSDDASSCPNENADAGGTTSDAGIDTKPPADHCNTVRAAAEAKLNDAGWGTPWSTAERIEIGACCNGTVWVGSDSVDPFGDGWTLCCQIGQVDSPMCTPWGPPMPPEMPLAFRDDTLDTASTTKGVMS